MGVAAGLGVLVGAEVITTTVALLEGGVVALLFVEPQLAFQSTVVVGWVPVVTPTFTPAVLCTFCPGVGEGVVVAVGARVWNGRLLEPTVRSWVSSVIWSGGI